MWASLFQIRLWIKFSLFLFAGKIDVGRYPDVAQKFHISTTSLTRQLPTVILFQDGKETGRVPAIISGKVQKFLFKDEDIINIFDLNNIYTECKKVYQILIDWDQGCVYRMFLFHIDISNNYPYIILGQALRGSA